MEQYGKMEGPPDKQVPTFTAPLWVFMKCFGGVMKVGNPGPFAEDMIVVLNSD
jgi:hypothetical protein